MTVVDAVIAAPVLEGPAAMYLTITNTGELPDTLTDVRAVDGGSAAIHRSSSDGGLARMEPVAFLEIPVGSTIAMRPGGTHVMVDGVVGGITAGDTVEVELTFRRAGAIRVPAVVVAYDELQERLRAGGDAGRH